MGGKLNLTEKRANVVGRRGSRAARKDITGRAERGGRRSKKKLRKRR